VNVKKIIRGCICIIQEVIRGILSNIEIMLQDVQLLSDVSGNICEGG
jgi:hypothetical protein